MEIVHVEKNGNFTWMKNIHLRDRFLSLKAKGLLSVMFSLPRDWDCTITGLAYISKEGISAIRATIKELEAAGYITRERIRNEAGQLKDMKYTIHETPVNREPEEPVPAAAPIVPDTTSSNLAPEEPELSDASEPASENPTFDFPTQGLPVQDKPTGISRNWRCQKSIRRRKVRLPVHWLTNLVGKLSQEEMISLLHTVLEE